MDTMDHFTHIYIVARASVIIVAIDIRDYVNVVANIYVIAQLGV